MFFFLFCQVIFHCIVVPVLFTQVTLDEHLGCFFSVAMTNNSVVYIFFVWKIHSFILTFNGKETNQDLTFELSNSLQKVVSVRFSLIFFYLKVRKGTSLWR